LKSLFIRWRRRYAKKNWIDGSHGSFCETNENYIPPQKKYNYEYRNNVR
jgi:hypothetical protein